MCEIVLIDVHVYSGFLSTRCQYNRLSCYYRYYVALNTTDGTKLPIHIEYPPCKNQQQYSLTQYKSHIRLLLAALCIVCLIVCFKPSFNSLLCLRVHHLSLCIPHVVDVHCCIDHCERVFDNHSPWARVILPIL